MAQGPIFIGGANRTGTTLMSTLLASHPNIAISSVEPKMWTGLYNQYGDLSQPANFDRCLAKMLTRKGVKALKPNPARVREEFRQGELTYGRLFALFQNHYAEQLGKPRWGDKTPNLEYYADAIFAAYPTAKILHMIRDPRDIYTSSTQWGRYRDRILRKLGRLGANTARWRVSVRVAQRNLKRYPDRYRIIHYETLALQPEETLREVCAFLGETFVAAMLEMKGNEKFQGKGGNSSFARHGGISTASIGRFRQKMSKLEIAFMQAHIGQAMKEHNYDLEVVNLSAGDYLLLYSIDWPINMARMSLLGTLEPIRDNYPMIWKHLHHLLNKA